MNVFNLLISQLRLPVKLRDPVPSCVGEMGELVGEGGRAVEFVCHLCLPRHSAHRPTPPYQPSSLFRGAAPTNVTPVPSDAHALTPCSRARPIRLGVPKMAPLRPASQRRKHETSERIHAGLTISCRSIPQPQRRPGYSPRERPAPGCAWAQAPTPRRRPPSGSAP